MRLFKKHLILPSILVILCVLLFVRFSPSSSQAFSTLCDDLTRTLLENNPLEIQFSIADPQTFDLDSLPQNLLPFHAASYEQSYSLWTAYHNAIQKLDQSSLPKDEQFLYHLLSRYIRLNLKNTDYLYYDNPLSTSSGIHSQLLILLSEYPFRSLEDIDKYFLLLKELPAYLDGVLQYMLIRESKGFYSYTPFLSVIKEQCINLISEEQLSTSTHFLQTSFAHKIQELLEQRKLSQEQADSYTLQNNRLLMNNVLPAYQALSKSLDLLQGTGALQGICHLENGTAYYELLMQENTNSDKSISEIKTMLYQRYDHIFQEYLELLQNLHTIEPVSLSMSGPDVMLTHLSDAMQTDFPSLKKCCDTMPKITLKSIEPSLASMCAPAFYMTPAIDDNLKNVIYINPTTRKESLTLYTTLAHEGFPGHLYQTLYSQNTLSKRKVPFIQQLLYFGGFTEGWAIYAELYSYKYIAALCPKEMMPLILLEKYNRELQLCLCSILDIYIHYDGATQKDVSNLLTTLGYQNTAAQSLYETICDAPCNYPKYYVGYLEILNIKNLAKKQWGDHYTDYKFHQWLLETGGGDFSSLTDLLLE